MERSGVRRRAAAARRGGPPRAAPVKRRNPRAVYRPALARSLVLGLAAGCYTYVPVPLATVGPRESVRVRVTDSAAARLVNDFGVFSTDLEGRLAREGHDSVAVSVLIARAYHGLALESSRQVLYFGRSEVVDVRRRELSRARTALATAGLVAAFVVVVRTVIQLGDPNPGSDERTPPPPPGYRGVTVRVPVP